ncbi:MAG: hypothetical protein NTW21_28855 [Verrucomicrobia bacterium]|nr:hypothetical protein [Verrucomicrobiota bacterium]
MKNPVQAGVYPGFALSFGDMYNLGIYHGRIGFSTAWGFGPIDTDQYVAGEWNHLAAVLVPTAADCLSYNISSYLNGTLIGSVSAILPQFLYRATLVGNGTTAAGYNNYSGLVYEPRISLGVLTPSQFTVTTGPPADSYDAWAGPGGYGLIGGAADCGADPDGDGFTNLQEFLFGTSPIAGNGTLVTSETLGGGLVLHWLQRASGCGYLLQESVTMGAGDWSTSTIMPVLDDQSGVPTGYVRYKATIPIGVAHKFFRVEGTEN